MRKNPFHSKVRKSLALFLFSLTGLLFAFIVREYCLIIKPDGMPANLSGVLFYVFFATAYVMQGYGLISVSVFSRNKTIQTAVPLFWGQFVLTLLWLGFFFGLRLFGLALAEILATLLLSFVVFLFFRSIRIQSALLLLPAVIMLALLSLLNFYFVI